MPAADNHWWVRALEPAFESIVADIFFLDRALYFGPRRSQIFFLGEESETNRRIMQDAVQDAWTSLRLSLNRLFPGAPQFERGAGVYTMSWMMRSCHTVGHCIEYFLRGDSPIDASSIESLQGELRDAQHDAVGWAINMLDGLTLMQRRELRRIVQLKARGGVKGVKPLIAKAEAGALGHQKWGRYVWAWWKCVRRREDFERSNPGVNARIEYVFAEPATGVRGRFPIGEHMCDLPPSDAPLASGLVWRRIGTTEPETGWELTNAALSSALLTKVEFELEEWEGFGIQGLGAYNFIRAGGYYYVPVAAVEAPNPVVGAAISIWDNAVMQEWDTVVEERYPGEGHSAADLIEDALEDTDLTVDMDADELEAEMAGRLHDADEGDADEEDDNRETESPLEAAERTLEGD